MLEKLVQLNKCKTIKDIYEFVNDETYDRLIKIIFLLIMIIPIVVMIFVLLTGNNANHFMNILFLFCGDISFVVTLWLFINRSNNSFKTKFFFFALMGVWAIFSTLVNFNNSNVWIGDLYRKEGLFTYLAYAGIYGASVFFLKENYRKQVFYIFILISSVLSILTILEFNEVNIPFFHYNTAGYSAIFHQFNHYGYYLLMSGMGAAGLFVIEENRKLKLFALIAYCLSVVTLIINDTFGCYLAFIAGVIFIPFVFILAKKKVRLNYFIPLILFVLITIGMNQVTGTVDQNMTVLSNDINKIVTQDATSGSAGTGRWVLWTNAIEFIKEKPLFGHGLDNLGYLYYPLGVGTDRPHNEYLQHAAHLGIPALIFYLCALASIFIRAFKNRATLSSTTLVALCAVGAYLVSALFGNTMYYTTPYFLILLGMSTKIGDKNLLKEN